MEPAKEHTSQLVASFTGVKTVDTASKNFARQFGAAVKTRRTAIGLRQEELAEIAQSYGIQVSQSYISRLEGGQRGDPGISLIVVLATILDISLDHILFLARSHVNVSTTDKTSNS